MTETLELGREAFDRRAWDDARVAFTEVDHEESLSAQDLELLADAAWWSGHPDESVDALERAYTSYVESRVPSEAGRVATVLAYLATRRLAFAIAAGWQARAARLLEDQPESGVHAWLKVLDIAEALMSRDDLESAIRIADEALDIARRTRNRDAETQALVFKGHALVSSGRWEEGLALIDEATASALSGDLSLRSASDVYCVTISACRSLADFARAGQWTEEADRWMSRHSVGGYPGVCSVHRAELKRLKGDWSEAEQEARDACMELERYHILDGVGLAHYEVGEIRLLMGDLAGADEAFKKAFEFGFGSQPGLALLMLARGQVDEAARALSRALTEGAGNQGAQKDLLGRARLLPAQVQVALARDDVETARAASGELDDLAREFERPAFQATALTARGEVALHEGDSAAAIEHFERAWRVWRGLGFPLEAARARMMLGEAHLAEGEVEVGRMEIEAARSVFERLGAVPDVRRIDKIWYRVDSPGDVRVRVTKTFMFTDIVTSTDLVGMIGDAAWESLLAWHDRELRAAFADHSGEEVNHTGDGFFVTFDQVPDAVEAAVAIQRRLTEHRRQHGFAPSVRIGLHLAEATRDGDDYRGQGVHLAARVGAVGGGDEVVISAAALEAMESIPYPVSDGRPVELKGITSPVQVHTIAWQ
jgi:class 3 adenylate cyclase